MTPRVVGEKRKGRGLPTPPKAARPCPDARVMGTPPRACSHRGDSRSPEGQQARRGLGHPKKDKAGLGLPLLTLWPSICGVWPRPRGFILQQKKTNPAASPRIALPPLSFYFATSLAPKMSLWAHSRLPSLPVSGCLAPVTPITEGKGDKSSVWVLEKDPWAAWQDKCLASAEAEGAQRVPAQLRPLGCPLHGRPRTRSPREGRARRCVLSSSTREGLVGNAHEGWVWKANHVYRYQKKEDLRSSMASLAQEPAALR